MQCYAMLSYICRFISTKNSLRVMGLEVHVIGESGLVVWNLEPSDLLVQGRGKGASVINTYLNTRKIVKQMKEST